LTLCRVPTREPFPGDTFLAKKPLKIGRSEHFPELTFRLRLTLPEVTFRHIYPPRPGLRSHFDTFCSDRANFDTSGPESGVLFVNSTIFSSPDPLPGDFSSHSAHLAPLPGSPPRKPSQIGSQTLLLTHSWVLPRPLPWRHFFGEKTPQNRSFRALSRAHFSTPFDPPRGHFWHLPGSPPDRPPEVTSDSPFDPPRSLLTPLPGCPPEELSQTGLEVSLTVLPGTCRRDTFRAKVGFDYIEVGTL